jgi:hypothetical protein
MTETKSRQKPGVQAPAKQSKQTQPIAQPIAQPNLKQLRYLFNRIIDFVVLMYAPCGLSASNPDGAAQRPHNAYVLTEYQIDIDRALTAAVKVAPYIEHVLTRILLERAGRDDKTLPPISQQIRNEVVKIVTPILIERRLEPWSYFERRRNRVRR